MRVIITHNGFHGTSTLRLNLKGQPGDTVELSTAQVERLNSEPCGMDECSCGESMIDATNEGFYGQPDDKFTITIPQGGTIGRTGNYPQR